jgi:branched-chain amino acid transport system ATP-binding protein
MAKPLILKGLSKNFGGVQVLLDLNLDIEEGEVTGVIGPNGAGKTTLFNLICGELPVSSGHIYIFGNDVTKWLPYRRAYLGLGRSFQLVNIFPQLTVFSNICIALLAQKRLKFVSYRRTTSYPALFLEVKRFLEEWRLWDKRDILVRNLSYGEQRQIDIIMALVQSPKFLLLDEPTAGLSPAEIDMVTKLIQVASQGITTVFIEHDMEVAFSLARRIIVLHEGRIFADGPSDSIRTDPRVSKIYLGEETVGA